DPVHAVPGEVVFRNGRRTRGGHSGNILFQARRFGLGVAPRAELSVLSYTLSTFELLCRPGSIWDAASAKQIAVLRGHEGIVYYAVFSPDGSRIVTASEDNTARIWDVRLPTIPREKLLFEACVRLAGVTKLTREDTRLAGYPDSMPEIDAAIT